MAVTSLTLLERLRGQPTPADWERLYDLYHPLIRHWVFRVPHLQGEQDDVCQEVFTAVAQLIPRFERRHDGSFRAWLRQITVRRIRASLRARHRDPHTATQADQTEHFLSQLEDPQSHLASEWDAEHNRRLLDRLYAAVRVDFEAKTWDMFRAVVLEGRAVLATAEQYGVEPATVVKAKARVLQRLRQEAGELLE